MPNDQLRLARIDGLGNYSIKKKFWRNFDHQQENQQIIRNSGSGKTENGFWQEFFKKRFYAKSPRGCHTSKPITLGLETKKRSQKNPRSPTTNLFPYTP